MTKDIMRLEYRPLTDHESKQIISIKEAALQLWNLIDACAQNSNGSRELSLAKTKVEESVMWATKHISAPLVTNEAVAA